MMYQGVNVEGLEAYDTRREARDEVFSMRLSELYDRVESASNIGRSQSAFGLSTTYAKTY